jgi:hypothetical protein
MAGEFDPEKARSDFLIAMYNQLMNDINRHIVVVWQSVTVLVGAFAVWSLVEKNVISFDIAVALIVGIAAWVLAHVYDAAYWYNRNLVIIANIERQFLRKEDLKEIHYYFGAHRKKSAMLTHLRLQKWLAVGVAALVLVIHFIQVIIPGVMHPGITRPLAVLPLAAMVVGLFVWWRGHRNMEDKYMEFLNNSPGRAIDTTGITYGRGHPPAS